MNLYQGNKGPSNDPGHAVEHLLYDVVVQGLPLIEGRGFMLKADIYFFRHQYLICALCNVVKKGKVKERLLRSHHIYRHC